MLGPRGLPLGQRAQGPGAAAAAGRPVRAAGAHASRPRSSSAPGRSSTRRSGRSRTSSSAESTAPGGAGRARGARGAGARPRPGQGRRRRRAGTASRPSSSSQAAVRARTSSPLALKYGIRSAPQLNDPQLRLAARLRRRQGAGHAEGPLRLPLPQRDSALIQVRLRPDLSEGAARRARSRSIRRARRDARAGSCPTAGTYVVTGAPVVVSRPHRLDQPTRSSSLLVRRARRHGARRSRSSSARACGCCRSSSRWPPRR